MADYITGIITKVTRNGLFGMVTFDEPYLGKRIGVINHITRGRMLLMGTAGELREGTRVCCAKEALIDGPDSLIIVEVASAHSFQRGMKVPSEEQNRFADEMLAELLGGDPPEDS